MTNTELLKKIIRQKGIKIYAICAKTGMTYSTFRSKLQNRSEFTAAQIDGICNMLGIDKSGMIEIFFAG